ncbi:MAG: HPr family phosphocarrier protein [Oscillospiraceae bacterium]|nr:HPr family phosphocarrier protein [Oscillospiraceae bacterium]
MLVRATVIHNDVGLHARPATYFIQKANEFKSSISLEVGERRVNAKSLLGVLSLGVMSGTELTIIADGPDEEVAAETLIRLIDNNLAENSEE